MPERICHFMSRALLKFMWEKGKGATAGGLINKMEMSTWKTLTLPNVLSILTRC